ncbi:MAG: hypothetical protein OXE02_09850 [Chloroflexi bacterium]|nr:hypothetical protein [Chloroflexota bacterium]
MVNLVLRGSALNGTIPGALGNLTELVTLNLEKTGMYGEVPSELGNLTNIDDLSVSYNRLSGSVPASLGNLTKAWGIHLNNNQFTGPIPPEFGNLDTEHFHLSDNKFSGSIPPELANIKSLGGLLLQNNRLTGRIPDELKNANFLHSVALQNNRLTGEIPDWFGDKPYFMVTLQDNQLTGTIPDLSGMSHLRTLQLGGNSLSGCVADSLRGKTFDSYSSTPPYGEIGAPFCADGTLAAPPSLTVSLENEATSHDSSDSFTFDLRFSEEVKLGYKSLRDHVFTVTGGTVTKAQRLDKPSNIRWQITVQPDSNADVTVVLPVTTDCEAQGAICTKIGGRPLSDTVSVMVQGPAENSPASGQPTISGTAQVGETLTASTSGISDADGLDSAAFSYQWLADDADISGATGNSYTLAVADEGKAVKVRVSFTDDAGHAETLTSAATAAVAAATPPAVSSIEVDGATVTVTFDEDLAPVSSVETLHLYWTILGTAVDQHPNRASVSGRTVTLEIGTPAVAGQTITMRYGWSGHLKDADGNAVESFSVTATNLTQ